MSRSAQEFDILLNNDLNDQRPINDHRHVIVKPIPRRILSSSGSGRGHWGLKSNASITVTNSNSDSRMTEQEMGENEMFQLPEKDTTGCEQMKTHQEKRLFKNMNMDNFVTNVVVKERQDLYLNERSKPRVSGPSKDGIYNSKASERVVTSPSPVSCGTQPGLSSTPHEIAPSLSQSRCHGHPKMSTTTPFLGDLERSCDSLPKSSSSGDCPTNLGPITHGCVRDNSQSLSSPCKAIHNDFRASQETLNTNVTSADEFVWIDSSNRLVELQQLPWDSIDLNRIIETKIQESERFHEVQVDLVPRISYYLQRVLVRLARESQRLSKAIGKCGCKEIETSIKAVMPPVLAMNTIKACLRATTMFATYPEPYRNSKGRRSGLVFSVGRMFQWMCMVKVGTLIKDAAAIYLAAALQTVLEEVVSHCLSISSTTSLNSTCLEQVVSNNSDWWGLFQPYAHISGCRIACGTLVLSNKFEELSFSNSQRDKNIRQILLTTCVGSLEELEEMIFVGSKTLKLLWHKVGKTSFNKAPSGSNSNRICGTSACERDHTIWHEDAIKSLYYFLRCSQLEYIGQEGQSPIQELVYERPYLVLPPIIEWLRVGLAFSDHRGGQDVDADDVLQAARILLPGMDCPPRSFFKGQLALSISPDAGDTEELLQHSLEDFALSLLTSKNDAFVCHALKVYPEECQRARNSFGLSALQLLSLQGNTTTIRSLLEAGVPADGTKDPNSVNRHHEWTPLCFASLAGHVKVCRLLIEFGASVIGNPRSSETPLEMAAAAGNQKIVELLMTFGACPFQLHLPDSFFPSSHPKLSPLSSAAAHGQRRIMHVMITQSLRTMGDPKKTNFGKEDEILSLEEILAEGVVTQTDLAQTRALGQEPSSAIFSLLTKGQTRSLQEAMYHAAENEKLDVVLDLKNFGVPWTLYSWVQCLSICHGSTPTKHMDDILQDFSTAWLKQEEQANYFSKAALPLLFKLFEVARTQCTCLILADIFSRCIMTVPLSPLKTDAPCSISSDSARSYRIDPKFVNNPELSDVQFRVENRIFYAHKLVLVTSSAKFKSMLNSKKSDGSYPILQINDIRYQIFEKVMIFLYHGGPEKLHLSGGDVLELMAAANFFEITGLLKYCEAMCSTLVDLDNIVSYYIHAKVYFASNLLTYCENFILKNMVALFAYDDSLKRLLFGKKLQSHNVLQGLLKCLQEKIETL